MLCYMNKKQKTELFQFRVWDMSCSVWLGTVHNYVLIEMSDIPTSLPGQVPLEHHDSELFDIIEHEKFRQWSGLELIASENFTSRSVMDCLGSCLTNKVQCDIILANHMQVVFRRLSWTSLLWRQRICRCRGEFVPREGSPSLRIKS